MKRLKKIYDYWTSNHLIRSMHDICPSCKQRAILTEWIHGRFVCYECRNYDLVIYNKIKEGVQYSYSGPRMPPEVKKWLERNVITVLLDKSIEESVHEIVEKIIKESNEKTRLENSTEEP